MGGGSPDGTERTNLSDNVVVDCDNSRQSAAAVESLWIGWERMDFDHIFHKRLLYQSLRFALSVPMRKKIRYGTPVVLDHSSASRVALEDWNDTGRGRLTT